MIRCLLFGHPAGIREQLRLFEPAYVAGGWLTWWTGVRCTRCGRRWTS